MVRWATYRIWFGCGVETKWAAHGKIEWNVEYRQTLPDKKKEPSVEITKVVPSVKTFHNIFFFFLVLVLLPLPLLVLLLSSFFFLSLFLNHFRSSFRFDVPRFSFGLLLLLVSFLFCSFVFFFWFLFGGSRFIFVWCVGFFGFVVYACD